MLWSTFSMVSQIKIQHVSVYVLRNVWGYTTKPQTKLLKVTNSKNTCSNHLKSNEQTYILLVKLHQIAVNCY
jgi:hypothetical protein